MALRTEHEAAEKLCCKCKTLQNWRWAGRGPRFIKLETGGIRYDDAELDRYLSENTFRSTTEARPERRANRATG